MSLTQLPASSAELETLILQEMDSLSYSRAVVLALVLIARTLETPKETVAPWPPNRTS